MQGACAGGLHRDAFLLYAALRRVLQAQLQAAAAATAVERQLQRRVASRLCMGMAEAWKVHCARELGAIYYAGVAGVLFCCCKGLIRGTCRQKLSRRTRSGTGSSCSLRVPLALQYCNFCPRLQGPGRGVSPTSVAVLSPPDSMVRPIN